MNYYEILEIKKTASDREIKKAYRKLAVKFHPDKYNGDDKKFIEISKAYETLSDPIKKDKYDKNLIYKKNHFEFDNQNLNQNYHEYSYPKDDINYFDSDLDFDPYIIFDNFFDNVFPNMTHEQMDQMSNVIGNDMFDFMTQLPNYQQKKNIDNDDILGKNKKIKRKGKSPNNYVNLHVKLEDIYMRKIKKLTLKRQHRICISDEEIADIEKIYKIPVGNLETHFIGEANDVLECQERGDLIFMIQPKPHKIYEKYQDYNLLIHHPINLYDIYEGFSFQLKLLDEEEIIITCKPKTLLNSIDMKQKVEGLGLSYINDNVEKRGDLYIQYSLKLPLEMDNIETYNSKHCCQNEDYVNPEEMNDVKVYISISTNHESVDQNQNDDGIQN